MKIDKLYDQLSSKEQYRLAQRSNLLSPKFPRSLFTYENRFQTVVSEISDIISRSNKSVTFLDVGCGDGVYENLLSKEVAEKMVSIGVDFSGEQLKKPQNIFPKRTK